MVFLKLYTQKTITGSFFLRKHGYLYEPNIQHILR